MLSVFVAAVLATAPAHDICKCGVSCDCGDPVVVITERATQSAKVCAITERAPAVRASASAVRKTETRQTITYRQPVGDHTHTCMNDKCKFYKENGVRMSWDHKSVKEHNCPACGAYQNVQDSRKQMVPVIRTETVAQASPRAAQAIVWPVAAASNCPNGNCAMPQSFARYR